MEWNHNYIGTALTFNSVGETKTVEHLTVCFSQNKHICGETRVPLPPVFPCCTVKQHSTAATPALLRRIAVTAWPAASLINCLTIT